LIGVRQFDPLRFVMALRDAPSALIPD